MPDNFDPETRGRPSLKSPDDSSNEATTTTEIPGDEPDSPTRLRVRFAEGFALVDVLEADRVFDDEVVNELGIRLQRLVELGHVRLLLNLGGLHYASSAVLGKLAWLNRKVADNQGVLRIYGLDAELFEALRICHLDRVFEVFADEAEALAASHSSDLVNHATSDQ